MNKPRPWQHVVLTLLSAITLLGLGSTPYNRYEWMLEDPQAKAEGLNYCALPTDPGEPAWEALAFLLPWALLATTISLKQRRLHVSVWYFLGLLACWGGLWFADARMLNMAHEKPHMSQTLGC